MESFGRFDRGSLAECGASSSGRDGSQFERKMSEASASSRASNLQKLMEKETENIRQWKVCLCSFN